MALFRRKGPHANPGDALDFSSQLEKEGRNTLDRVGLGGPDIINEDIPDAFDAACSLWGVVAPAIVQAVRGVVIELQGADEMANSPWFNLIDSAAFVARGSMQLSQVMYDETHRPWITGLKGVVNISSGITLGVLTGMALTAGTAAALAISQYALVASMGVTFLHSCDDVLRAGRRMVSPEYWLIDSLKALEKLDLAIEKQKIKVSIEQDRKGSKNKLQPSEQSKKWEELEKERAHAVKIIRARIEANPVCKKFYEAHKTDSQYSSLFIRVKMPAAHTEAETKRAALVEKDIQSTLKKEFAKAVTNSLYVGLLFTGTLLLMLPGGQIPGMILLGAFALGFLAKSGIRMNDYYKNEKSAANETYKNSTDSIRDYFGAERVFSTQRRP